MSGSPAVHAKKPLPPYDIILDSVAGRHDKNRRGFRVSAVAGMVISLSPPYNAGMVDNSVRAATFAAAVVRWQKKCGRNSLPWQDVAAPYETWISEVMLQQTQAATVIPYYQKFVRKWRDVAALARARPDSVMAAWSGLGYYARARNLHAAAQIFRRNGFPQTAEEWRTIPGIGKSTAAAIAVFAYQERAAILDGNVKRVLARVFAVQTPIDTPAGERELWTIAESLLPPRRDIRRYTQGMMDLGGGGVHSRKTEMRRMSAGGILSRAGGRHNRGFSAPQTAQNKTGKIRDNGINCLRRICLFAKTSAAWHLGRNVVAAGKRIGGGVKKRMRGANAQKIDGARCGFFYARIYAFSSERESVAAGMCRRT